MAEILESKYVGIDYGTHRVGVALSDEQGSFAFPHDIITPQSLLSYIEQLAKKISIKKIIIGYSIASNGVENSIAPRIERCKKEIEEQFAIPVVLEREDFSTVEAHRYQIKAGKRDDSAAAIILQRFLDKQSKT